MKFAGCQRVASRSSVARSEDSWALLHNFRAARASTRAGHGHNPCFGSVGAVHEYQQSGMSFPPAVSYGL